MSDGPAPSPRPVSTAAIAAIFVLLALFWVLAVTVYVPHRAPPAQNLPPDNLPKELAWRATPATRRAHLAELRAAQMRQADSYGWVDRNAGVVQLPVALAMELVVREHGGKK